MTKKKRMAYEKFIFYIFLGTIFLFTSFISGCGNKEADIVADTRIPTTAKTIDTAELHYRENDIPIPDDFVPVAVRFLQREIFLFDGRNVLVMDQEGSELRRTVLSENEEFAAFDLKPDRSFWVVSSDFGEKEAVTGRIPDAYHFVHIDRTGTEIARVSAEGSQFGTYEDYVYPYRLLIEDDYIYFMSVQSVYILDHSGKLVYEVRASGENQRDQGVFRSLLKLNDLRVALTSIVYGNETSHLIQFPNPENREAEEISIAGTGSDVFAAGKEAALFLCTSDGFYDYDPESGEQRMVFNNLKFGIDTGSLIETAVLFDDSIAIAERTPERRVRLTRYVPFVPSEDSSDDSPDEEYADIEKQVITLSVVNNNDIWLTATVASFNRSNKYYYIEMNDYYKRSIGGDYSSDTNESITRFNLELMAGDIPDIIVLPAQMSPDSYISKGMFADLNEFMDNDPDFRRADYLPGLFEALDREGKMYEIFPMFWFNIFEGKTKDVGTDAGWTLDEFAAFLDTKPDARYILGDHNKRFFIHKMVENHFINPLTGETKFDREVFTKILKIADRFPDTSPYQDNDFSLGVKDGDPLLIRGFISGYSGIKFDELFFFGEEVTIKGWPSSIGNGLQFMVPDYFSISAQAENPDGAWEFIKYILNHAETTYGSMNVIPVSLASLEEKAERALVDAKDPSLTGYGPFGRYYTTDLGLDRADVDKVMSAIKSIKTIDRGNMSINRIVAEEIEVYLSGQKSPDQIADIIENRIGIYLAEQE